LVKPKQLTGHSLVQTDNLIKRVGRFAGDT
jgi:hypothetical protein